MFRLVQTTGYIFLVLGFLLVNNCDTDATNLCNQGSSSCPTVLCRSYSNIRKCLQSFDPKISNINESTCVKVVEDFCDTPDLGVLSQLFQCRSPVCSAPKTQAGLQQVVAIEKNCQAQGQVQASQTCWNAITKL